MLFSTALLSFEFNLLATLHIEPMLEEKNDNLQNADGKLAVASQESNETVSENQETPITPIEEPITEKAQQNDHQKALNSIEDSNAEESEDETLKERHDIPMQDYDTLSMEELVDALKTIVETDKVMSVKEHVDEIKKSFLAKYNHFIEEKKKSFKQKILIVPKIFNIICL